MNMDEQLLRWAGDRAVGLLEGNDLGGGASKIQHAVHPAGGRGRRINGASPVPPAPESRLRRIDFGNWTLLARKLWFGGAFLDEKMIQNLSGKGLWEV